MKYVIQLNEENCTTQIKTVATHDLPKKGVQISNQSHTTIREPFWHKNNPSKINLPFCTTCKALRHLVVPLKRNNCSCSAYKIESTLSEYELKKGEEK
jgi:hypothetical protein